MIINMVIFLRCFSGQFSQSDQVSEGYRRRKGGANVIALRVFCDVAQANERSIYNFHGIFNDTIVILSLFRVFGGSWISTFRPLSMSMV